MDPQPPPVRGVVRKTLVDEEQMDFRSVGPVPAAVDRDDAVRCRAR